MANDMQIFDYEGNQVRTVQQNGETWWVLRDVCAVLGLTDTNKTAERLESDELTRIKFVSGGQNREMLCVSEAGLYSAIIRSDKPEAKKFKRWVTHEVLPMIRKHGMYAPDELLDNPDVMIAVLQALKFERSHNAVLEQQAEVQGRLIAEMNPKAAYCDTILACADAVPVSVIAKDYGWSAVRMNAFLHECGVQYKCNGVWLLYQKFAGKGYTCSHTHEYAGHAIVLTYWTQKGRLFLYNLLKNHGILPEMEVQSDAR